MCKGRGTALAVKGLWLMGGSLCPPCFFHLLCVNKNSCNVLLLVLIKWNVKKDRPRLHNKNSCNVLLLVLIKWNVKKDRPRLHRQGGALQRRKKKEKNGGGETKFRILILHSTFYILHSTFYILLSTFYFLLSTFYFPHSTFYILHSFCILNLEFRIIIGVRSEPADYWLLTAVCCLLSAIIMPLKGIIVNSERCKLFLNRVGFLTHL